MELCGAFVEGLPFVAVRVSGARFRALLDTGFDGYAMLPQAEISRLGLQALGKELYRTADGRLHEGNVYLGRVDLMGEEVDAAIDSTDGYVALVGMKLLAPLRLVMEPARQVLTLSSASRRDAGGPA